MTRRIVTIAALLLAALPAAAPAQAPDERAAARAFADAATRMMTAVKGLETQLDGSVNRRAVGCWRRLPERRQERVEALVVASGLGQGARVLESPFLELSTALHGVQTADPALQGGRTAWRRLRRVYMEMAAFAGADVCAEARAYAESGWKPTPVMRRARSFLDRLTDRDGGDFDRRVERAVARLKTLGIPAAEADRFAGRVEETEGGERPGQVPASIRPTAP